MEQNSQMLSLILDLGEMLLVSGAEVNRVEDTIKRLAAAYGFQRTDVFTITSSIVVTVRDASNQTLTETRRILSYETDMHKIDQLNSLSRQICHAPISPESLQQKLQQIRQGTPYCRLIQFLDYAMISAVFSLFFGGNLQDAFAAALCGCLLKLVLDAGKSIQLQNLVLTVLCSFAVAAAAQCCVLVGIGSNFDQIVVGNIMLLIPGVSFTVSLRDMISGDTISGLLGFAEAILKALAIAMGFAIVILLMKGGAR